MSESREVPPRLDQMSRVYGEETWRVYERLDCSLNPRGPDSMHDLAAGYLSAGAVILDAGCRDAAHLIRLVQAHDGTGAGIDPVQVHVERAQAAVATAGLGGRIEIRRAVMERLPFDDQRFDLIWCRDVLEQVEPLGLALTEAARVLTPRGRMLAFTMIATDLLAPGDYRLLEHHLGNVMPNLAEPVLELAFKDAGLVIERREVIGTQWREYAEERSRPVSRALLRLSRLRRLRESVIEDCGEDIYLHVEANLHWEVFQLLGKLLPVIYVLGHR